MSWHSKIFNKSRFSYLFFTVLVTTSFPIFAASTTNICSNLSGDLYGLCNSYCIAKQCASSSPNGSQNSCDNLKDKFFQRAGFPVPCLAKPSISVVKKTNGVVEDPTIDYKLLVGSAVNWSYIITNNGNVSVTINSVVDSASLGSNPTVTCNNPLPAALAVGGVLNCSASGIAQQGQYTNTVTVSASSASGSATAEANGSYLGVKPGIAITSAPSSPSVVEGSTYQWNYTVSNTGSVPLANISYSEANVNCPTALAAGGSENCSSPVKTAGGVGTESDSITASASFTDNNNNVQQVSDTAQAQITITPDPVLVMVNHTVLAWPDGTPYAVTGTSTSCTLKFTGTIPQFPNQVITNNTYFLFINQNNNNGPAQELRIIDPIQGIICDAPNTNSDNSLIIKDICPSNVFSPSTPSISLQQFVDWCSSHTGQSFMYHPQ